MNHCGLTETDLLFDSCAVVKAGAVREVRSNGELFVKLDKRANHSFKTEFNRAKQLKKHDIPVVSPVRFTSSKRGNYLITRAFKGVSLDDHLKENIPEKEFFYSAADLLKKMLDSGFLHTDFHLGNLLYAPEKRTFSLVDVDGIKKLPRWMMRFVPTRIKFHLLTEFRMLLDKTELLELFQYAGVPEPERFYRQMFVRSRRYILHTWPRRRRQILNAYPKFTTLDKGVLTDSSFCGREIPELQYNKDAKALFLAHFYLNLIKMPHRAIPALDESASKIAVMPEKTSPVPEDGVREMISRMELYGIKTEPGDWQQGDRLPELSAVEKVAAMPFICEGM